MHLLKRYMFCMDEEGEIIWAHYWAWVCFLHLVASIWAMGYYSYDEHFKVYEYAHYLIGKTPVSDLPWEFQAKIYSFLWPLFMALISQGMIGLGLSDPFFIAFCYQLTAALLGLGSLYILIQWTYEWMNKSPMRSWTIWFLGASWYIPYLHSRPSGENVSASFFILGTGVMMRVLRKSQVGFWPLVGSGALWGCAFFCRYHIGVMLLGAASWLFMFIRPSFKSIIAIALGFVGISITALTIDRAVYGVWQLTPWEYLKLLLIKDVHSTYGVSPWYTALTMIFEYAVPPLSLVMIGGVILFWIFNSSHLLTWITLPFFVVHTLIGHKEYRFFFPLAPFVPLMVGCMVEREKHRFESMWWKRAFWTMWALNIALLGFASVSANRAIPFYKYIYREKIPQFYTVDENPYKPLGLNLHFYRPNHLDIFQLKDYQEFLDILKASPSKPHYLFRWSFRLPTEWEEPLGSHCPQVFSNTASWLQHFNIGGWIQRTRVWSLYKCAL